MTNSIPLREDADAVQPHQDASVAPLAGAGHSIHPRGRFGKHFIYLRNR